MPHSEKVKRTKLNRTLAKPPIIKGHLIRTFPPDYALFTPKFDEIQRNSFTKQRNFFAKQTSFFEFQTSFFYSQSFFNAITSLLCGGIATEEAEIDE
jgi:hypothetical protein